MNKQEALQKAQEEREAILARIGRRLGSMEIEDPPSLSPFLGQGASQKLLVAARKLLDGLSEERATADEYGLGVAVDRALAPDEDFDERSTPVAVISLQGLRRLDSLFSELEQRREGEA